MTRWGGVYLHCFHRGDQDRDPHDHPFWFKTFPLGQGYTESVFDSAKQCFTEQRVPPWRWSHRKPTHCHRVIETDSGKWPLWTVVIRGPKVRSWGFWVHREWPLNALRWMIPWREYAWWRGNSADDNDEHCA